MFPHLPGQGSPEWLIIHLVHRCQSSPPPALKPWFVLQSAPVHLLTSGVVQPSVNLSRGLWRSFVSDLLVLFFFFHPQNIWNRFLDFDLSKNHRTWNKQPTATEFLWRNLPHHLPHRITHQSPSHSVPPSTTLQEGRNLGKNPFWLVRLFHTRWMSVSHPYLEIHRHSSSLQPASKLHQQNLSPQHSSVKFHCK